MSANVLAFHAENYPNRKLDRVHWSKLGVAPLDLFHNFLDIKAGPPPGSRPHPPPKKNPELRQFYMGLYSLHAHSHSLLFEVLL